MYFLSFSQSILLYTVIFICSRQSQGETFKQNYSELMNKNDERLEHFWRSVNRLTEKSADSLGGFANSVEEIAFYLDRGTSQCYQIIEYVLRSGLHEEWTAKMITANSLLAENLLISKLTNLEQVSGNSASCLEQVNIAPPEQLGLAGGNVTTFDGQYCLAKFSLADFNETLTLNLKNESTLNYFEKRAQRWMVKKESLQVAICVPSICEVDELELLIGKCLYQLCFFY